MPLSQKKIEHTGCQKLFSATGADEKSLAYTLSQAKWWAAQANMFDRQWKHMFTASLGTIPDAAVLESMCILEKPRTRPLSDAQLEVQESEAAQGSQQRAHVTSAAAKTKAKAKGKAKTASKVVAAKGSAKAKAKAAVAIAPPQEHELQGREELAGGPDQTLPSASSASSSSSSSSDSSSGSPPCGLLELAACLRSSFQKGVPRLLN